MAFREIKPSQNIENLFEDAVPISVPREVTTPRKRLYTPAALPSLSIEEEVSGYDKAVAANPVASVVNSIPKIALKAPSIKLPTFAVPSIKLPAFSNRVSFGIVFKILFALVIIWFGAATSGTFYGPASGKFAGLLAVIFYQYQLGTMLEFLGILLLWDSAKSFLK